MSVLNNLEPKKVFHYFEAICGIPHGSSNTKQISDYLVRFAKERDLKYIQDQYNNVIIFQNGTDGYEESAPVILQGHMDMVCEKEKDAKIDFAEDGLSLVLEGNKISADKTTLGGDDGIAVAFALAILDSSEIPHPPLEVILTVDEEIGMLGATALDTAPIQSRLMLNLDSEEEGKLLVSCAGGATAECILPVSYEQVSGKKGILLTVTGITGGHSGVEIHKQGANSNKILGRVLYALSRQLEFYLCAVEGGLKDNAIPRESKAVLFVEEKDWGEIKLFINEFQKTLKKEYQNTDKDITLLLEEVDSADTCAMTKESTERVIVALVNLPNGVQKMSSDIEGLVQTSLNLGILKTEKTPVETNTCSEANQVKMSFSIRSSVGSEKEELLQTLECLIKRLGGNVFLEGSYPAWEYKKDSHLRELMVKVYREMFGKEPEIEAVHAGLECGIFAGKLTGLDCISYGPEMSGIHTTEECLYVDSVQRTWEYTLEILKQLK